MSTAVPVRVAVFGAQGRMGRTVAAAFENDPRFDLVAEVARDTGRDAAAAADVMIDFTVRESAVDNVRWAIDRGIHCVVGTSGLAPDDLAGFEAALADGPGSAVLVVPNFSVSALLARRFALQAAERFDSVELIEYYSSAKVDAPSGTSVELARSLAGTRAATGAASGIPSRGETIDGVPVHAVRMAGFVSRQEIIFGNGGEFLRIGFETVDRAAYADGVMRAALGVMELTGLQVGLETVID